MLSRVEHEKSFITSAPDKIFLLSYPTKPIAEDKGKFFMIITAHLP